MGAEEEEEERERVGGRSSTFETSFLLESFTFIFRGFIHTFVLFSDICFVGQFRVCCGATVRGYPCRNMGDDVIMR